ncbi:NADP-dependent oxidoreductase [Actinocorallia sp. A-T 12471]|uniref:NADP-dependent oxidoreductase n=1 Tax=Actinocorallia sp. A-T 12471 TaxID=3089813 RepID=UPI0029CBC6D0|nr:NADP-dependent oxidoreductase [Actinocorallia sp. A-T 12471]MDX6743870.1 NADP-dependent oxidoreductase [Actinocorallia sp. A-T 12471]
MASVTGREWRLMRRPVGTPVPEDFALTEVEVPEPGGGQVLVRNLFLSVDPYMRGRMSDAKSYAAPYELGEPMTGGAIGEVIASEADGLARGDLVRHMLGWREYALLEAGEASQFQPAEGVPLSAYLGVLGMTGLTAYAGLMRIAGLRPGDRVFVSGAAGAVGSTAGQIARIKGAGLVVGSAGSREKVAWVRDELGFDTAFNYKDAPVDEQLAKAAPEGIDVYFDNVGGDHLQAALGALRLKGRIAICGMISRYNDTEPAPGPNNLSRLIQTRGRIEGFLVGDHADLAGEFHRDMAPKVASGELKYRETFTTGIDSALDAFLGILKGDNTGKMLVRLTDTT